MVEFELKSEEIKGLLRKNRKQHKKKRVLELLVAPWRDWPAGNQTQMTKGKSLNHSLLGNRDGRGAPPIDRIGPEKAVP